MKKNSLGIKIKRILANNNRFKSIIYKSVFTIVVLLLVLLISKINTRPTNTLADRIKTTINYEYQIKEDSVKIYHKAKEVFNSTVESIPVFNTGDKLASPVSGTVHRAFDAQVETPDGIVANGGLEIKLDGDMPPKSIIDGRVTSIQKRDNRGYFVTVEDEGIRLIYGYLKSTSLKEGNLVNKEDVIGEVGINKDGNKYLRLELYIDDKLVDPEKHIEF